MYPRRGSSRRICNGKRRYDTSTEAEEMARHRREESGEADLDIYPCRVCGGWHIGHSTPRKGRRL